MTAEKMGEHQRIPLFGGRAEIIRAPQGQLDVQDLIREPEAFFKSHGRSFKVDQLVDMRTMFEHLIGQYDGRRLGEWDPKKPEALVNRGIVVMEYFYAEAARIVAEIDKLAQRLIADETNYDDPALCAEYYALARDGYDFLRAKLPNFGFDDDPAGMALSLVRGGLVSTRLGLGAGQNEILPNEVPVITKRVHPIYAPESHLGVTVKWVDRQRLQEMHGQPLRVYDFVNPASGASTIAALGSLKAEGVLPANVHQRGISMTAQGALYMQGLLDSMGLPSTYASLGVCDTLAPNYYLAQPGRAVGDAGRALRHFLPAGQH